MQPMGNNNFGPSIVFASYINISDRHAGLIQRGDIQGYRLDEEIGVWRALLIILGPEILLPKSCVKLGN